MNVLEIFIGIVLLYAVYLGLRYIIKFARERKEFNNLFL